MIFVNSFCKVYLTQLLFNILYAKQIKILQQNKESFLSSHTGDYLLENEQIRIGNTSFLLT